MSCLDHCNLWSFGLQKITAAYYLKIGSICPTLSQYIYILFPINQPRKCILQFLPGVHVCQCVSPKGLASLNFDFHLRWHWLWYLSLAMFVWCSMCLVRLTILLLWFCYILGLLCGWKRHFISDSRISYCHWSYPSTSCCKFSHLFF